MSHSSLILSMAADVPKFRFLELPERALHNVLRFFDGIQIVVFSLLSPDTKSLVKSLNLSIGTLSLQPDDNIVICVDDYGNSNLELKFFAPEEKLGTYEDDEGTIIIPEPTRVAVKIREEEPPEVVLEFKNPPEMTMWRWMAHLQDIFNHTVVDFIRFEESECLYDMQSVYDVVDKLNLLALKFEENCGVECVQFALKEVPEIESVFVHSQHFEKIKDYGDVLMRKFTNFSFRDFEEFGISLDHILLINSVNISIFSPGATDELINQYIFLWMNGANPRMKKITFERYAPRDFDENLVLRGLNWRPVTGQRVFNLMKQENPVTVENGFEILVDEQPKGIVTFYYGEEIEVCIFTVL